MKNQKSNILGIKVGDVIKFTNKSNFEVVLKVTRVEEKSWYCPGRNSYGTLEEYSKMPNFIVER